MSTNSVQHTSSLVLPVFAAIVVCVLTPVIGAVLVAVAGIICWFSGNKRLAKAFFLVSFIFAVWALAGGVFWTSFGSS